jgi:MYXO-CTERM domain-containing protein
MCVTGRTSAGKRPTQIAPEVHTLSRSTTIMTAGINLERFLLLLAGIIWGLALLDVPKPVIAEISAALAVLGVGLLLLRQRPRSRQQRGTSS